MRVRTPARLVLTAALALGALAACGDDGGSDSASPSTPPSLTDSPSVSPGTTASAPGSQLPTTGGSGKVVIAAANFPENQILAEVYKQALAAAGYDASVKPLTTRPNILTALEGGQVQVEPDYVGSLTEYYNKKKNGPDAAPAASGDLTATYTKAQAFAGEQGLKVLTPSPAADQNAFVVTREFSDKNSITKLSQLAGFTGPLVLGGTPECKTYSLCQPGLEKTYGIKFTGFEQTDLGGSLSISKLKSGKVQLGEFLSSDGNVKVNDFVLLEDDKQLQSVDNVVPVLAKSVAADPLIATILNQVSAAMTTENLVGLNAAVSVDRKLASQAAGDFLKAKGLVS